MIQYEAICKTGIIREKNEDNLYIEGKYLPVDHGDMPRMSGRIPEGRFAVFDGMGGEQRGDVASFLAAKTMCEKREMGLMDLCLSMNDAVCDYTKRNSLRFCGSTAAVVFIRDGNVSCMNIGDSRIYLYRDGFRQVSRDHAIEMMGRKKLTQCLGIPEDEFVVQPSLSKFPAKEGDRILICSDGVTDMISDEELAEIKNLEEIESLIQKRGEIDNYTAILLRIV